jgi:phosphatidylglycerophosphatase A
MLPSHLTPFSPVTILATWFWSGLIPFASGTWGSLAALPFAWVILWYGGPWVLLAASIAVFALGCLVSDRFIGDDRTADPGAVVIDEVAGQWLTLTIAPLSIPGFILGFLLFRLFDIVKPWPANWADRSLKGGLGIMTDDMVAGLYGGVVLFLADHFLGGL